MPSVKHVGRSAAAMFFVAGYLSEAAVAQRVNDNTVTAAEDAFGFIIGQERVGLYTTTEVRGFSPITAGNIRLEGLYIDRPAGFTDRLTENATVRVGLTAQNYLFPAPTGIVDYRLRKAGDKTVVSNLLGHGPQGGKRFELDGKFAVNEKFGVAAGGGAFWDVFGSGATGFVTSMAFVPRWRPAENIEITPFWSLRNDHHREASPIFFPAGAFLPERVERQKFNGPEWVRFRGKQYNFGAIGKMQAGQNWAVTTGVFRSISRNDEGYANLLADVTREGTAQRRVQSNPPQRSASTSGELRVSRNFAENDRLHTVHASLRARDKESLYGGGAVVDFGPTQVDAAMDAPEPAFIFGERTSESVKQVTGGLTYEGRWKGVGSASFGVQKIDYEKEVDQPNAPLTTTHDNSWLYTATAAVEVAPRLALYGSYTSGLEESGLAPDSAANRTQALPAIHTDQTDVGLRWAVRPGMNVVMALFEVEKPNFAADENNIFTELGKVRHRGMEFSLTGRFFEDLNVVAGAVLMKPRVSGEPVAQGRVGPKPVGQTGRLLTLNANYNTPWVDGLALVLNVIHQGERTADRLNLLSVPESTVADVGLRYRFAVMENPALLRLEVRNISNKFDWRVVGNRAFEVNNPRSLLVNLAVDY